MEHFRHPIYETFDKQKYSVSSMQISSLFILYPSILHLDESNANLLDESQMIHLCSLLSLHNKHPIISSSLQCNIDGGTHSIYLKLFKQFYL